MMVVATSPVDLSGLGREERVTELRRRLAAMPGGGAPAAVRAQAPAGPASVVSAPSAPVSYTHLTLPTKRIV